MTILSRCLYCTCATRLTAVSVIGIFVFGKLGSESISLSYFPSSYFYGSQIVQIKQHVVIGKELFHKWQYIVFYAHFMIINKSVF